jgi:hypothetical protein
MWLTILELACDHLEGQVVELNARKSSKLSSILWKTFKDSHALNK